MLKDDKAVLLRRLATAEAGAGPAAARGSRQAGSGEQATRVVRPEAGNADLRKVDGHAGQSFEKVQFDMVRTIRRAEFSAFSSS